MKIFENSVNFHARLIRVLSPNFFWEFDKWRARVRYTDIRVVYQANFINILLPETLIEEHERGRVFHFWSVTWPVVGTSSSFLSKYWLCQTALVTGMGPDTKANPSLVINQWPGGAAVTKLVFYRISLYNYQRLPINAHTLTIPHLITIEDHWSRPNYHH